MPKKERKYVLIYFSHKDKFKLLGNEKLGMLVMAAMEYAEEGIIPDFGDDLLLQYAWTEMKEDVDVSISNYEAKVNAGSKGGKTKAVKEKYNLSDTDINTIKKLGAKDQDVQDYIEEIKQELAEKNLNLTGRDFVNYACGDKDRYLLRIE